MMKNIVYTYSSFLVFVLMMLACDDGWLEVKRDRALIVPTTLKDMRLLLRNETITSRDYIALIALADDDYYLPAVNYPGRSTIERNSYVWKADLFEAQPSIDDWDKSYAQVVIANIVLEGLENIPQNDSDREEWRDVKGGALHLRARAFYNLAQTFAKPFTAASAASDLGIPLRTASDLNAKVTRSTLAETYDQIAQDFEESATLLRESPEFIRDPSSSSAHGWAARCYLSMENFEKAFEHADKYLKLRNQLLDFNTLDATSNNPIGPSNVEVIQHTEINPLYASFVGSIHRIEESFRQSYDDNDLRKVIFFRNRESGELGTYGFKGSYSGNITPFSGIATDEIYLIRAECNARLGKVQEALNDINTLLEHRWADGTFVNRSASDSKEALDLVLSERRKELLMRGLRWSDLRRFNKTDDYAVSISRNIDGEIYTLEPNDPRYVLPIPDYIIKTALIDQNQR